MPIAHAALRFVVIVSMLLLSSTALAHAGGIIVVVGGDADRTTRQRLSAAVERGLRDQREDGRQLALPARDVDALLQCVARDASKECAAAFMRGAGAGASRAVVMRVDRRKATPAATTITGWILAPDGTILVIDQGACDACTPPKLETAATALLGALMGEAQARTARTLLIVRTTPRNAQIEIDGQVVGFADPEIKRRVYPGTHRIVAQLRDHETTDLSIELFAGETKTVDVKLKPLKGASPPPQPPTPAPTTPDEPRGVRWGPWLTIGAGAVVATAGVVFLVRDQGDPSPDDGPWSYERRETTAIGATTTALGGIALGAGLWWLLRDDDPQPTRAIAPAVGVGADTVTLTLSGAF